MSVSQRPRLSPAAHFEHETATDAKKTHWERETLFYCDGGIQGVSSAAEEGLDVTVKEKEVEDSLGIPDTSLSGLSTRTALRVRRSTGMFMWDPAVARILTDGRHTTHAGFNATASPSTQGR